MHTYYKTTDGRTIALRDTGMGKVLVSLALKKAKLTRIKAPLAANAQRVSGKIPTCCVLSDGSIGSI